MEPVITVLLPTRGRPDALRESVMSLIETADYPPRLQILCAVDEDDEPTLRALERDDLPQRLRAFQAPERYGYDRLHEYVNFLAGKATGGWLMLWNDDARMMTPGWDSLVAGRTPDHVLWPAVNHAQGGNLFPIWPVGWYHALGYVSLAPNIDVWISELARRLGVEQPVNIMIMHDRADVTGGHDDQTYREGRAVMGQGNHPEYDSQRNRAERARAVKILERLYASGA